MNSQTDWANPDGVRTIILFNSNFSPLAGILGCGYYLHTCAPSITKTAKNQDKVGRDLFIGYTLVFLTYAIVGGMGYIGFIGVRFASDFSPEGKTPDKLNKINSNCLQMFDYVDVGAFILRIAIFCCLFSTYPLLN